MSGIQNLVVGKVIPTPFGRPDVIKMMQTKTPFLVFFISIARPSEEATKEKVLKLIESCSRSGCLCGKKGSQRVNWALLCDELLWSMGGFSKRRKEAD